MLSRAIPKSQLLIFFVTSTTNLSNLFEEAEEIADLEIKAKANGKRRYEQSKPKNKTPKERKVDETKKHLFEIIIASLKNEVKNGSLKNEVEYSFDFGKDRYTLKLTKHRPPKK